MDCTTHPFRTAALLALSATVGAATARAQTPAPQPLVTTPPPAPAAPTEQTPTPAPTPTQAPPSAAPQEWSIRPLDLPHEASTPPSASVPTAPAAPSPAEDTLVGGLLAGFHNDLFFIANRTGSFWIAPTGRLQLDAVAFVGGVTDDYTTGTAMTYHRGDVKDGFLMRRARLEMVGGFLDRYTWQIGADFDLASAPVATDLIFNARIFPMLNGQLGQFDAPFTLENRTPDKYLDFMERSLAVRALGVPTNKEMGAMVWGEDLQRLFYYSVGVFNGDGQNRLDRDNNLDVMGRVFAHPFITLGGPMANLQLGGSLRYGSRGASVDYAYNTMSTPGGYTFFNSAVVGGASPVTVVPDGTQFGAAGELDLPIDRFDLRGEVVYVSNQTREMAGTTLSGTNPMRLGDLTGIGWYGQVGYWIWGTPGVNGRPGYENPPALNLHTPDPAQPRQGVEILARVENVHFTYNGGSRATGGRPAAGYDGTYDVTGLEVGANYWATRHVRFSLNYLQFLFGSQPATSAMPADGDNRAHGPHGGASSYGELMARVGLAI